MKNAAWIAGPVVAFLVAPLFVAVMVMTFTTAAADCLDQQQSLVAPNVPATVAGAGEGTIRLAHANIKVSLPRAAFHADLDKTLSLGPDLVSLNEVSRRSNADLSRPGYAFSRTPQANRSSQDTAAVMWRTDRWSKLASGSVVMVSSGPQKWDSGRTATWVTLQSAGVASGSGGLGRVSMVSLHHMINPEKYGPNKLERQRLYRAGLEKVGDLVTRLSATGPVFIGGDFNSQYTSNDMWGPRRMLDALPNGFELKATFDELGAQATHDGGGIIDYLFYQPAVATPTRQWIRNLNSDHKLIAAELEIGAKSSTTAMSAQVGIRAGDPSGDMSGDLAGNAGRDIEGADVRRLLMQITFAPDDPQHPTMNGEQVDNAIAIGHVALNELDLPPDRSRHALEVAIATAIQESRLANLDGGDRDSAGLFQQRPSTGWGSHHQVTNPRLATLAFFGRADHTNNPGLLDIPGWSLMSTTQAAQAVQRSPFPDAYARWATAAREIAAAITGSDIDTRLNSSNVATAAQRECMHTTGAGDGSCPTTGSPAEAGLTPDALLVLRCVHAEFGPHNYGGVGDRAANPGSDHPAGRAVDIMINAWNTPGGAAEGTRIAEWVRAHGEQFGVTYIIWRSQIWTTGRASAGWRPYTHPSGATDPTNAHMDHVHISVHGNAGTGLRASGVIYPVPAQYAHSDAHNWHDSGPYWTSWHSGTDFTVACGSPVLAAHAGTIDLDTNQSWAGRWLLKVSTGPRALTTWYAHLHTLTVDHGDSVRAGQQIGTVGGDKPEDGNSSGCHLHFEVHLRNGSTYGADNVDPSKWLRENARNAP